MKSLKPSERRALEAEKRAQKEALEREKALENYKKQLRLSLMLMLEDGDHIVEPGEETEDDIDWESLCP